ncbi:hypothetical protein [Parapedobacter indicus]|uniref:Uncharacterized protein n=1 Tax=Parapedobacter indicus TaxID=1477437 RepID=A0A1I3V6U5_9SPHI|nr:hypothetical protein [Parapedobacter indicus]PPK98976.1 hypothetical protein CLV26_1155 [Parapedobacter indicus]SFJ89811.1 hypothetical protein SAMN05444682_115172 [Parapedobacter indicus]
MGMKPRFTKADVRRTMRNKRSQLADAIISRLELIGFEFVKMARSKNASTGGFNDVTGNLRSSIGFAVLRNGETVNENFEQSNSGTDKATGVQAAKSFIDELKGKFPRGYALIVVAGMSYAAAVESRGKDVITGSGLVAEVMLKQAMQRLKDRF